MVLFDAERLKISKSKMILVQKNFKKSGFSASMWLTVRNNSSSCILEVFSSSGLFSLIDMLWQKCLTSEKPTQFREGSLSCG